MADCMRWRYGDTNPVVASVEADTVIEIGDLVQLWNGSAHPAGGLTLNAANELGYFHDRFLGVAMQRSRQGDTDSIRVSTTGVFEFQALKSNYQIGDLVAPFFSQQGKLSKDTVGRVIYPEWSIGRIAKTAKAADLMHVLVDIQSTIMLGGPQSGTPVNLQIYETRHKGSSESGPRILATSRGAAMHLCSGSAPHLEVCPVTTQAVFLD